MRQCACMRAHERACVRACVSACGKLAFQCLFSFRIEKVTFRFDVWPSLNYVLLTVSMHSLSMNKQYRNVF